jgi:hypothetical protein
VTAKSDSNSTGAAAWMAMWKHIAIFYANNFLISDEVFCQKKVVYK